MTDDPMTEPGCCPSCGTRIPGQWDRTFQGQITSHPYVPDIVVFLGWSQMSTKTTNLINKAGEVVGIVSFDESAHSWRLACKAEPNFQRTFAHAHEAFYFWYSSFDPQSGKLRLWNGRPDPY